MGESDSWRGLLDFCFKQNVQNIVFEPLPLRFPYSGYKKRRALRLACPAGKNFTKKREIAFNHFRDL